MHPSFTTAILAAAAGLVAPIAASPRGEGRPFALTSKSVLGKKVEIGAIVCGNFATADKRNFMQLQYDLRKHGGNSTIGGKQCYRVSCWNTSGIYVCNDNEGEVEIPNETIANFASHAGGCCKSSFTRSKGLSGQAFSNEGWNVGVGYANCNHHADQDDPSIFIPPGLNGPCKD
ncbi:hypothetical protein GE09DRAFT_1222872 [Coniochaeta sp. 2T2.1]|nr:hypothetical protein GE09DRAFT_1222872 [Coniochaeta sp. 2T2.1]